MYDTCVIKDIIFGHLSTYIDVSGCLLYKKDVTYDHIVVQHVDVSGYLLYDNDITSIHVIVICTSVCTLVNVTCTNKDTLASTLP